MERARTVIITGGARGIGQALSQLFAKRGYQVLIHFKNSEKEAVKLMNHCVQEGASVAVFQADVSIRSEVDRMMEYCLKTFGAIDVLINNAGIAGSNLFDKITEEEWDLVHNVNLKGVFHCCQAVVPNFIRQKSGNIINISSIWGMVGASCEVHYSAAKAGVIGLSKALAKELGPSGIRVNCVAPGVIDTDMVGSLKPEDLSSLASDTPLGRIGKPEEVAECCFFLASDKAAFITGQVFSPNGGFVI